MTSPPRGKRSQIENILLLLTQEIAGLMNSGVWTERALAAKLEISQPHLHNVLHGRRKLTLAMGDQVLDQMGWTIADLFNTRDRTLGKVRYAELGLGAGIVFPGRLNQEIAAPNAILQSCLKPLAVTIADDKAMLPTFEADDCIIVDRGREVRLNVEVALYYVVQCGDDSKVRRLRQSRRGLYLVSEEDWSSPIRWEPWEYDRLFDVIQGTVIARRRPPDDTFQLLVPPSASS